MNLDWQSNWDLFVDTLQNRLRAGDTPEALCERFGGRSVTWDGVLEEKSIDSLAPGVLVSLPNRQIELGEGRVVTLDGVSVPVADDSIADWKSLAIGTRFAFSAMLGSAGSPFPPIEVKHLRSGESVVFVRLSEGRPVR
jgi:hypothetical protein